VTSRVLFPYGSTSIFSNTYFIVFLSIGLSVLTYYTVENPIRHIKGKRIVIVLFMIMIGIGLLSYWKSYSLRGND
jgi:peptidoglycan/LPS O-acetylase OafA/YrhL